MPKPDLLPPVDWRGIFDAAGEFDAWLGLGENAKHQEQMRGLRGETALGEAAEEALKSLEQPVHVLALAEDWCPDVVRHVPVLQRMADASPLIRVRYVLRKTSTDLLVRFLTNGTESVPKFGFFNNDFALCCMWGPMLATTRSELAARARSPSPRGNGSASYTMAILRVKSS